MSAPATYMLEGKPLRTGYGHQYRDLMERLGLEPVPIADLAKHMGYRKAHLGLIFQGKRRPSAACLELLAKSLGVEPGKLVRALDAGRRAAR